MAAMAMKSVEAREVRRGLTYSLIAHGAILAAILINLPWYDTPENLPPPPAIDVQLAKVGLKTNVPPELRAKASPPPPARQTHVAKPVAPKPLPKVAAPPVPPPPKPHVAVAKPVPVPPPPKPEATPKPTPEPVAKPKPKPKPEPKPKMAAVEPAPVPQRVPVPPPEAKRKNAFDANKLAQMLNLEIKHQSTTPDATKTKKRIAAYSQTPSNTSEPLSLSLIDAVREQIERNWLIPVSARDSTMVIHIRIDLNPDGTLQGTPEILDTLAMNMPGNAAFRATAQSAVRAIYESQPFKMLPADRYQEWQTIDISFSPKDMVNQ